MCSVWISETDPTQELLSETPGIKSLPPDARLRPFRVRQTRPIRSRSNVIYYFIALEEENSSQRESNRHLMSARQLLHYMFLYCSGINYLITLHLFCVPQLINNYITRWCSHPRVVHRCIQKLHYRSSQNDYRQSCYSWEFISRKLPLPLPSWNSDELPLPLPSWPPQSPLHFQWLPITV